MKHLLATTILGAALVTSASAQSALPEGFDIDGHVSLSYVGITGGDSGEFFAASDLDVSWTSGTFGLDVSMVGFAVEDDSISAFFGALTYTFGNGHKFSIGAPRAAYDEFARFRHQDYFEYFAGVGGFGSAGSILTSYSLTVTDSPYTIVGLRYDGSMSGANVAASYHGSPDGAGFLVSSSADYQLGSGMVAGGFEYLNVDDIEFSALKLRYDTKVGKFDLGAGVIWLHIQPTSGPGSVTATTLELAADYSFTDRISAGGMLLNVSQDTGGPTMDQSLYGLRGRYNFNNGASANASLLKYEGGSDLQYNVSLRYDF